MGEYEKEFETEKAYLKKVTDFLTVKISEMRESIDSKKHLLHRERQEEGVIVVDPNSPGRSADLTQHLLEDTRQLASIELQSRSLANYERMLSSPYFGRFDFLEDGSKYADKVYIGLHNVYDAEGDGDILVYDWRAPICSIFYRSEPGRTSFTAPDGEITGEVTAKRQYRIEHSLLKFFFDCSLYISDEILGEALAQNASPKMHSIVRTIQGEQDKIIRDTESDLLIAQGAAGSGKTTIALHRIAYLLYHSSVSKLTSKNIVIISLSDVFSNYIGTVLPELGEENVKEITFDKICTNLIGTNLSQSKAQFAESLLVDEKSGGITRDAYTFKGSPVFIEILRRFLSYYERRLIPFNDIYYSGKYIAQREGLKALFLNNKIGAPTLSRLRRIESILLSKIDPLQHERRKKLQAEIKVMQGHQFDFKAVARYIEIKEIEKLMDKIHKFTRFDALSVYKTLFSDRKRFDIICKGLDLPTNIGEIFEHTAKGLSDGTGFEDAAPLAYLSILMDNPKSIEGIRHVVVDEAQDYLPIHYAIFGLLFKGASFTVLGDINQQVETGATMNLYEDATKLLNKKKPMLLKLEKSYRASYEIMNFAMKIPEKRPEITPFERHEKEPELIKCSESKLADTLAGDIKKAQSEGFGTVAVICKTAKEAAELYEKLKMKTTVRLLKSGGEVGPGVMVMPAYLSKGLEFDCVFVPDLSEENYGSGLGRQLLYISSTRPLHTLTLYYQKDSAIVKRLRG